MKNFFKNVLANIVAILIVAAIFFVFMIVIVAVGSFSGNEKAHVKDQSVLCLDLKTQIIDSPSEIKDNIFTINDKTKEILILDALEAIKNAKTDDKIKGISIETDGINAKITQLDNIRTALLDFKKSGKFVYAYGNTVSQPAYFLGSVADKYYLNPAGKIDLKGLSTEVIFFKNFAEKYGVGTEVIRHGKFKAAVEPYLRNEISPENQEQLSTLLNDVWSNISTKMSTSRKIAAADFKTTVDSLYGMIPELAIKYKLADQLVQKSQYDNALKSLLKLKSDDKLNKISFDKYIKSLDDQNSNSNEVAMLYASGQILDGEGYNDIHARNLIKNIKDITENDDIKAVVLRINSPGGSANASDEILYELQQLKAKKPLVVSFGDYAASGGYYIAMAADKIYSEPNTITGSIGVFGMITYFKDLANKNGIRSDAVKTNTNANMYSPINGVSPGAVTMLTKSVEGTYKRFVYFVTQNRKKTFQQIDDIGGGRVWSGTRAKEIGLVDEIGSITDAINFAAQKAGIKEYSLTTYPEKVSMFEQFFGNGEDEDIAAKILQNKLGKENYQVFKTITNPNMKSGTMMQMPYELKFD